MRRGGHVCAVDLLVWCVKNALVANQAPDPDGMTKPPLQEDFVRRGGHVCAVDLLVWCDGHEPPPPAPGKDDFHMETVCTLVNIIGNAARSSVKVWQLAAAC